MIGLWARLWTCRHKTDTCTYGLCFLPVVSSLFEFKEAADHDWKTQSVYVVQ